MHVEKTKKAYSETKLNPILRDQFEKLKQCENVYNLLVNSIAPEIYGLEDVKKESGKIDF